MINLKKYCAIASMAILCPTNAFAELAVGDTVGMAEAEIRASIEGAGYAVNVIEFESDEFEIEATRNGQEFEIEVDPAAGTIVEIEMAEASDDDDDDNNEDDSDEDGADAD